MQRSLVENMKRQADPRVWPIDKHLELWEGPGFKPRPSSCFLKAGNFTPLCLSLPRCINGYGEIVLGEGGGEVNPVMD